MASARQRNNRWTGLYRDASGAQKSAGTYATEKDALRAAEHAEALANPVVDVEVHAGAKRGRVTVSGYAPVWLAGHRLEATSREGYGAMLKHVVKALGGVPVADLDPPKVRTFIRGLEASKLSGATVGHVFTVLHEMVKTAVNDGLLDRDVCAGIKIEGRKSREMTILTPADYRRVLDATPQHYKLLIELLASTGLRWGEAVAVKSDAIVQDAWGRWGVEVIRTIAEVNGKPIERNYGKTVNAKRFVTIPEELARRLLDAAGKDGYAIRAPRGGYLSRSNFRRIWLKATAAAGVTGVRVHDVRHSHLSWLANNGADLVTVMKRAGHSDLKTTSRYLHVVPGEKDRALAALETALAA